MRNEAKIWEMINNSIDYQKVGQEIYISFSFFLQLYLQPFFLHLLVFVQFESGIWL